MTIQNGLTQNSVVAIEQDKNGFIWLGTRHGLNRYDGIRFKNYTHDALDSASLPDNLISVMLKDSGGNLWIACLGALCRYNDKTDNFSRITLQSSSRQPGNSPSVDCMYEDREHRIWLGTREGIFLKEGSEPFSSSFVVNNTRQTIGTDVNCIFQSSDGNMWIGTSQELIRFTCRRGKISDMQVYKHTAEDKNSIAGNYITAIGEDKAHRLWIGTQADGLTILTKQAGIWQRSHLPELNAAGFVGNNLRELVPDKQGNMWIGTQNGLLFYDATGKKLTNYQHDPENKSSLSNNSVHSIYHDNNGSTWVGTYHGGVNVTYNDTGAFRIYRNEHHPHSLNNNVVSSIVEDNNQHLWIGTEGGGLYLLNRSTGEFRSFRHAPGNSNSPANNFIKCLHIDKQGQLWIGFTFNGGVDRYNPATGGFTHYPPDNVRSGKITSSMEEVTALQETTEGNILVGARSGIYEIEKRPGGHYTTAWTKKNHHPIFSGKSVQSFFTDSHGNFWVGTTSGLYMLRRKDNRLLQFYKSPHPDSLHEHNINFITEDIKRTIWIGAYYGGLYQYNQQRQSFINYTEKNGLPSNNVLGLLEDTDGKYWVSTDKGLSQFNHREKAFTNYTVSDGLPGNRFNQNAFLKNGRGEMFFGSDNGITSFFPQNVQQNKFTGPVVFTSLKFAGNTANSSKEEPLQPKSITGNSMLTFTHLQNSFTIEFALLNFIKPEKNRYAYMMEGLENQWHYVTEPSAAYSGLAPGKYTLKVKAANNDGYWTSKPAAIQIHILPPLWKTWWAYTLYVLVAFCALLFLLIKFIRKPRLVSKPAMPEKDETFIPLQPEAVNNIPLLSEPQPAELALIDETFINRITEIIEDHIDDDEFGVTILAQKAGMSKPVLYKRLKAVTNMTANDFIKYIRLKKAEQLLISGKMTIAEVAYMVGFTRREHFSEEFKKQFGKTPTEYLKNI